MPTTPHRVAEDAGDSASYRQGERPMSCHTPEGEGHTYDQSPLEYFAPCWRFDLEDCEGCLPDHGNR